MPSTGDNSFESLALPHLETVYRVARRLSRNDHEAEDLTQETMLKAYRAFSGFEMREFGIKPWLLRILNNTFLNRRAKLKNAPRAVDREVLEQTAAADDADIRLDFEKLDAEVKDALERLAPEFRTAILLWGTMEFSYQEIAEILDVPIGTVMSRLHRARRQLAQTLKDYARAQRRVQ